VLTCAELSRVFAPDAFELVDQFLQTIKLAQAQRIFAKLNR